MRVNGTWFECYILIKEVFLPQVDGAHKLILIETKTCGRLKQRDQRERALAAFWK